MSEDKPKGYFKFALAVDCETTGLAFEADDPSEGYQAVSWGLIVVDADTLKPIEKMYVEIKWNEESKKRRKEDPSYGKAAEEIHGLTFDYLEENGIDESQAVLKIGELILKYFSGKAPIRLIGHNVATFDLWFLRRMFRNHGIELKFGNRHIDTSTIGFVNWKTYNSDDLFNLMLEDNRNKVHNALDDAMMSLNVIRITRKLFEQCLKKK